MENFIIYIVKASSIIALFYLAYQFLLKKETFFTTNRYFLLVGLLTATLLPFAVITKTIYMEIETVKTQPVQFINGQNFNTESHSTLAEASLTFWSEINLYTLGLYIYALGVLFFTVKFVKDIFKLLKMVKSYTYKKENSFKMIDSPLEELPFSFFNYIIFNSANFSADELNSIICHEKVHCKQKHSIDMLLSQFYCILFWFNPFIWLYKRSIAQNLEFIADCETTKQVNDKRAYQKTLIKITLQQDCITITNHFYQSLIKKRIVMINKPLSKRRNSLKTAIILPLLIGFVMLFQTETIAQDKNIADIIAFEIKNNMTDNEIIKSLAIMNTEFNCNVAINDVTRNDKGLITALEVHSDGNAFSANGSPSFFIIAERTKYGTDISISTKSPKKLDIISAKTMVFENTSSDPSRKNMLVKAYGSTYSLEDYETDERITFLSGGTPCPRDILGEIKKEGIDYEKAFIMIDSKECNSDNLRLLSLQPQKITSSIVKTGSPKLIEKYGKKAKNGIVIITTQEDKPEIRAISTKIEAEPTFHIAESQQNNAVIVISHKSNQENLDFYTNLLKDMGINIQYSNIERDSQGLIKKISIVVEDKNGSKASATWRTVEGKTGIPNIKVGRLDGTLVATSDTITN